MPDPIDEQDSKLEDNGEQDVPTAERRAEAARRRRAREERGSDEPVAQPSRGRKGPFEFKTQDNPKFLRLGKMMTFVAVVDLIGAAIVAVWFTSIVLALPMFLPITLVYLVPIVAAAAVGVWTLRAGHRFTLIASTRGSDVPHLMAAIDELTKLYLLQVVALVLGIGAAVLGWLMGPAR